MAVSEIAKRNSGRVALLAFSLAVAATSGRYLAMLTVQRRFGLPF